jgi:hypothetical protein
LNSSHGPRRVPAPSLIRSQSERRDSFG